MKLSQFQALAAANPHGLVAMRVADAFTPYAEGDIAGFPPDEALKLFSAGVVRLPDGVEAPPATEDDETAATAAEVNEIEIPADWEGQHYLKNRALASKIAGQKVDGKEAVNNVIRAELARRAEVSGQA